MTDQAQSSMSNDLVGLYAGRVSARYRRPVAVGQRRRASGGVHTFGRRPEVRQLGSSRRRRTIATLMATAMLASTAPAMASGSGATHEIQQGETLSAIARDYGMTVDDLVRLNEIQNPDQIFAGDHLRLGDVASIEVGDTVYRIKEGDSLSQIAINHGVSLSDLLAINELDNPDLIFAGDYLIIPTRDQYESEIDASDLAEDSESVDEQNDQIDDGEIVSMHLVAQGETLSSIAQRYDISVERLASANDIEDHDQITAGTMLQIPGQPSIIDPENGNDIEDNESSGAELDGMPVLQQSLPLSSQSAALSMATAYWGHQVSEWVFIENMPYHPNPHQGFRGDINGEFGGTDDYGVYAGPLADILANYGFFGEEFYAHGDTHHLTQRLDFGMPVLVWMTSAASDQQVTGGSYEGQSFALVPEQQVVVAYGYDEDHIYVADPGVGQQRAYEWDVFINSWNKFDGMSLAVFPKN